jgi:hypothetical protein
MTAVMIIAATTRVFGSIIEPFDRIARATRPERTIIIISFKFPPHDCVVCWRARHERPDDNTIKPAGSLA